MAAENQIAYYSVTHPIGCVSKLGLFGLSAAEVPVSVERASGEYLSGVRSGWTLCSRERWDGPIGYGRGRASLRRPRFVALSARRHPVVELAHGAKLLYAVDQRRKFLF